MRTGLFFIFLGWMFSSCALKSGQLAPEMDVQSLAGQKISTQNLRGKIVLLNIWATWCGPCVQEIPQLNALKNQFLGDTNVVFLALTDDPTAKVERFLANTPFAYDQIISDRAYLKKWSGTFTMSYPQHIIVDQEQKIHFQFAGTRDDLDQMLAQKIRAIQ